MIMQSASPTTVGGYLTQRLEELGIKHVFGVPGDYVLKFLDVLTAGEIQWVGECNELNAGYAADGYARLAGIGAVCVTYGVGGLSLVNAVAGAKAEGIPLIVISGGPGLGRRDSELMLHHTLGDKDLARQVFEPITARAVVLGQGGEAVAQIDDALTACVAEQAPVYIEVPLDLVGQPCAAPAPLSLAPLRPTDPDQLRRAVDAALERVAQAERIMVWAGNEIGRQGAEPAAVRFLEQTGLAFAACRQSKAMLSEGAPGYLGVYKGDLSDPAVRQVFESANLVLNLGVWPTSINTGGFTAKVSPDNAVQAFSGRVLVGDKLFAPVALGDFIAALIGAWPARPVAETPARPAPPASPPPAADDAQLSAEAMFQIIAGFLKPHHLLLTDTGGPMISSDDMPIPDGCRVLRQAYYLSIGYTVPAAVGVCLAAPHLRPVVLVGDGSFQMTAQAVSTMIRLKLNPIVLVWNNDGYQTERIIHDGPFNDLQAWRYGDAPRFFGGGEGSRVSTAGELSQALARAEAEPQGLDVIEVVTGRWDLTRSMDIAQQAFNSRNG